MPSNYWTDPTGQQHVYQTTGEGLEANARRAVERQRVWSGLDPTFDNKKLQVGPTGQLTENKQGFPLWESAAVLAAPLAAGFLPGLLGGGAPTVGGATDLGGMYGLPGAIGSQGASGAVYGAGAAGAGAAGSGGLAGLLGGLYKGSGGLSGILGAAGAGLGAASQAQAQNRGSQFAGQLDLEALLMARDAQDFNQRVAREQEGRTGQSDAWRKLLASQHLLSPGARPQLSPYSVAPRQATGDERAGADAMTREVLARLQGGNPIAPVQQRPLSVDPRLLKAGRFESASGWLSPILSSFNIANQVRR